ncbi:MAG: alpha/beta fold hydrolase [Streptosporangiaceae bacterium]
MSWLRCPQPRPWATTRLVCLPHAGGSAVAYRQWGTSPAVEVHAVQYPGRADRMADPFVTDPRQMARLVAGALTPLSDRPLALFGHSMGAVLAYEVARILQAKGSPPVHLFVSGTKPPHRRGERTRISDGTDDAVVAELVKLGGTDADVLADPELRALVLPYVRADFKLIESYEPLPGPRLAVPVTCLIGDADDHVNAEQAARWAEITDGPFDLKALPGDHFYLVPQQAEVLAEVLDRLHAPAG